MAQSKASIQSVKRATFKINWGRKPNNLSEGNRLGTVSQICAVVLCMEMGDDAEIAWQGPIQHQMMSLLGISSNEPKTVHHNLRLNQLVHPVQSICIPASFHFTCFLSLHIYFNGGNLGLIKSVLAWLLAFIFTADSQSLWPHQFAANVNTWLELTLNPIQTAEMWTPWKSPSEVFRVGRHWATSPHSYSANQGMNHACLLVLLVPSPDTSPGGCLPHTVTLVGRHGPQETCYPK